MHRYDEDRIIPRLANRVAALLGLGWSRPDVVRKLLGEGYTVDEIQLALVAAEMILEWEGADL